MWRTTKFLHNLCIIERAFFRRLLFRIRKLETLGYWKPTRPCRAGCVHYARRFVRSTEVQKIPKPRTSPARKYEGARLHILWANRPLAPLRADPEVALWRDCLLRVLALSTRLCRTETRGHYFCLSSILTWKSPYLIRNISPNIFSLQLFFPFFNYKFFICY